MPYKAIKKFEFDGVTFKIGDTVPDRLIVDELINGSTLVEEVQEVLNVKNIVETPKEELLLETPSAVEITVEDIPKELIVETAETAPVVSQEVSKVEEVTPTEEKPSKNKNKK